MIEFFSGICVGSQGTKYVDEFVVHIVSGFRDVRPRMNWKTVIEKLLGLSESLRLAWPDMVKFAGFSQSSSISRKLLQYSIRFSFFDEKMISVVYETISQ